MVRGVRIELWSEGGLHYDTLVPARDGKTRVWKSSTGDVVDLTGEQAGRLLTLPDLLARLETIDEAEKGRPILRLLRGLGRA